MEPWSVGMDLEPCAEIQYTESPGALPLVLIHDGGGTIVSYYFLGELHRQVYGIANPHFDTGEPWVGGLREMAELYAGMIKSTIPSGPILLGGWSMGGLLAIEVSKMLARDSRITVRGLLLIDTTYPPAKPPQDVRVALDSGMVFESRTKQEIRDKITASMREARRCVGEWSPDADEGQASPPAILLRAEDPVKPRASGVVARVDFCRQDAFLGWGETLIKESWTIPGNHYNVFAEDHLDTLTQRISRACEWLQRR